MNGNVVQITDIQAPNYGGVGSASYRANVKGGIHRNDQYTNMVSTLNEEYCANDNSMFKSNVESEIEFNHMLDMLVENYVTPAIEASYGIDARERIDRNDDFGSESYALSEACASVEAYKALMVGDRKKLLKHDFNDAESFLNESTIHASGGSDAVMSNGNSMTSRLFGMRTPFITRNWIENVMKSIIPTEVPSHSLFNITKEVPMAKLAGESTFREMADVLDNTEDLMSKSEKRITDKYFPLPIDEINLVDETDGCSIVGNYGLNRDVRISKVKYAYTDKESKLVEAPIDVDEMVTTNPGSNAGSLIQIKVKNSDGSIIIDKNDKPVIIKLQTTINFATGLLTVTPVNEYAKEVQFDGTVTDSFNNYTSTVDWTFLQYQIQIPLRPHVSIAITEDKKLSMMQNFNVDYQTRALKLMHELLSHQEDAEMLKFMRDDLVVAQKAATFNKVYNIDTVPPTGIFAADPRKWVLDNLKDQIEMSCYALQDVLKEKQVMFILFGNPINCKWLDDSSFEWTKGKKHNGSIDMNHNIWFSNSKRDIKVVSSNKFKVSEGLQMIVIPLVGDKMTYKHYVKDYYMTDKLRTVAQSNAPHITITKSYATKRLASIHTQYTLDKVTAIGTNRYK